MSKELKQELVKMKADEWFNHYKPKYQTIEKYEKDIKFFNALYDDVFKLDGDYFFTLEKPSIKKDFCFAYGMYLQSSDEEQEIASQNCKSAREDVNYFLKENLMNVDSNIRTIKYHLIEDLEQRNNFYHNNEEYISYCDTRNVPCIYQNIDKVVYLTYIQEDRIENSKLIRKATKEDLELILTNYIELRQRFVKRLSTYLKKYGLSKVNAWTYLRD